MPWQERSNAAYQLTVRSLIRRMLLTYDTIYGCFEGPTLANTHHLMLHLLRDYECLAVVGVLGVLLVSYV
jgi:hypothetical protein